ncbi:MAG: archaetidylserine decarboxylase [Simkaniaceae bacterium]|nr:archaetidylserine decarboxylase [Simkaniaceae bacterium]
MCLKHQSRRLKNRLFVYDRLTKNVVEEKIYGGTFLKILYGNAPFVSWIGKVLLPFICRLPMASKWYGFLQKRSFSKAKIIPFIHKFHVTSDEFEKPVEAFESFNDFFIRKLKRDARPIEMRDDVLILPSDGRFLALPNAYESGEIWVKGQSIDIKELLGYDQELIKRYDWGSMLIARLAPVDYHRFHFPCDCIPSEPKLINGPLYSVNPIALKNNIRYLTQNKRVLTLLETRDFGVIAYIEIGATHVGSIHQTFTPGQPYKKGDEKGYFSFGGSSLILLFEQNRILFSQDLIENTQNQIETYAHMGQVMALKVCP